GGRGAGASATASHTYGTAGVFTAKVRVADPHGAADEKTVQIQPGNTAPTAFVDTPSASLTWAVGDTVSFTGHATDPQQGALAATALSWQLRMQHCETVSDCHAHVVQNWTGVASGSFSAPDHGYPSYLDLALTATDAQGLTNTVVRRLDPKTVALTFQTSPSGLSLSVGSFTGTTPFTRTAIQGATTTVSAPSPQTHDGNPYLFGKWSDTGAQTHVITAPATAKTYTATYGQLPTAVIGSTSTTGPAPLAVTFDATGSTDPDPADQGNLAYQWDFTNDGTWDSTASRPAHTYASPGAFTAKLRVTDTLGLANETTVQVQPGNTAPTAFLDTPSASLTWAVGNTIAFSGHATDPQQGTLAASALSWKLRLQHCVSGPDCHSHIVQTWTGVASGSFSAPDHEYPSYLELELTATDQQGLTHTVVRRLDPQTVLLTFDTVPTGMVLTVGSFTGATPFVREVIQGSSVTVNAPTLQTIGGAQHQFGTWSDGGAQSHVIIAPSAAQTYAATYGPACGVSSWGPKRRTCMPIRPPVNRRVSLWGEPGSR
ncbi:MAG TPA: hypothetical protein DGT23_24580, partial [Micromonosporaceae bacterium]|nr:hypothetical protein [Micromonosporaceae bacterium]